MVEDDSKGNREKWLCTRVTVVKGLGMVYANVESIRVFLPTHTVPLCVRDGEFQIFTIHL